jgi:uncharacterized repeat protein (TIGR01451 family)
MRPLASSIRPTTAVALLCAAIAAAFLAFASTASAADPPAANPDLRPACGTKLVLVLDESQSIGNAAGAVQAVRDAANAFASGLADTGSQLAVIEFGGTAKRVFDYTTVTSGAAGTLATTFKPYFDGTAASPADVYSIPTQTGPLTNWEAALKAVSDLNAQSGVAPLVVFVTDGDPTRTIAVGTNTPSDIAVGPAITQANAIKAQGSHILAVGVGNALTNAASLDRLKQVSGPDVVTSAASLDLATTDVLSISDFSALPNALRTIVRQLCAAPPVSPPATVTPVVATPVVVGTQQARLAIDKRGPATAKSGVIITYTMKVTNTSAVTANNVVVRDRVPTSMSLAKKTAGVQLVKGFVVIQVGTLAPGASKTVRVQFRIDRRASGLRTNTASASASNATTVRDSARTRIILVSGRIVVPSVTG